MTWEGRPIRALALCPPGVGCGRRPAMYVDGGTHAREWVVPAAVTYLAYKLTLGLEEDMKDLVSVLIRLCIQVNVS